VTSENGESYSIRFKISNTGPLFDSVGSEKKIICTALNGVTTHLETWKTWESQGIPKWSGKSQGKWTLPQTL